MLDDTYALCIGVADYLHVRKLSTAPGHDATDLAALLRDPERGGYKAEAVQLLLDGQATRDGIRAALDELTRRSGPNSTVLVQFAGHGLRTTGPRPAEYLLPVEACADSETTLAASAISTTELAQRLGAISARRLLLVLDCCHAGGLGTLRGDSDVLESDLMRNAQGLSPATQTLLAQGRGRALLLAARDTEAAFELPGDRNGLFTKHLLAGLRGAAVCTGGLVRVFDLFDYVQQQVQAERPTQHPVFKAELEENFPLVRCPAPPLPSPTPQPDELPFDVFLHALERGPDRQWLRNVLRPALLRRGLRVHDADQFPLGQPRIKSMEQAVLHSRYTVAVLSAAYLTSGLAELGDLMAQHLGTEQSHYRLLAVLREPCQPRLGIRLAPLLDLSLPEELEPQLDRLTETLRQPPATT